MIFIIAQSTLSCKERVHAYAQEMNGGSLLDTLPGLWNIDKNVLMTDGRVQKDLPYAFTIGMFRWKDKW
jgi:hypothetical protein